MRTKYRVCYRCGELIYRDRTRGRGWYHIAFASDSNHRAVPVEEKQGQEVVPNTPDNA